MRSLHTRSPNTADAAAATLKAAFTQKAGARCLTFLKTRLLIHILTRGLYLQTQAIRYCQPALCVNAVEDSPHCVCHRNDNRTSNKHNIWRPQSYHNCLQLLIEVKPRRQWISFVVTFSEKLIYAEMKLNILDESFTRSLRHTFFEP